MRELGGGGVFAMAEGAFDWRGWAPHRWQEPVVEDGLQDHKSQFGREL